jgi:hypothetical protein
MADETSTGSTGSGSGATRRRAATAPKRRSTRSNAPKATRSAAARVAPSAAKVASSAAKPAAKPAAKAATKPAAKARAAKPAARGAISSPASAVAPTATATKPATKAPASVAKTEVIVVPAAFDAHDGPITPTVAVTRHLEWLDYALAAARAEETWRRGRVANATKKNRAKRETRLAEVIAEIDELSALLIGLRALRQKPATRKPARSRATGTSRAGAGTSGRRGAQRTTGTGAG